MTPRTFLIVGGVILVLVGILGMVGVIGPTAEDSLFGDTWWFDNGENWAHTGLGVVGLIAAFLFPAGAQRALVLILAVTGIAVGLYSLFKADFLGANLENPADTILHIVIGLWAFLAFRGGRTAPAPPPAAA